MNSKQRDIRKAIAIENLYPPDNLISNYQDFLKIRDILSFYQFNPAVFFSLVTLTNDLWNTTQRINRTSLVEIIKRYASKKTAKKDYYSFQQAELHELPAESIPGIFSIFKKSFEKTLKASKCVEQIQKTCSSLLIDKVLDDEELQWLCENITRSTLILNRILRYPKANKIISKWTCYKDNA